MREGDIRDALRRRLSAASAPGDLVLDEFGVCEGRARADLVVVNGTLVGFEIKSADDTLARLRGQAELYARVFDSVVVVTADRHAGRVATHVPRWFGLEEAVLEGDGVRFVTRRSARPNPRHDAYALAQLLWRDEALEELAARGLDRGVRSKARHIVWARLCEALAVDELRAVVRTRLKVRWSAGRPPS